MASDPHKQKVLTNGLHDQAFENTSTSVAASQMRNALNNLADTVKDPKDKQVRPATTTAHREKAVTDPRTEI